MVFLTAVKMKLSEQVCLCTVERSGQNVELILLTIIIMIGTMKMTRNITTAAVLSECLKPLPCFPVQYRFI